MSTCFINGGKSFTIIISTQRHIPHIHISNNTQIHSSWCWKYFTCSISLYKHCNHYSFYTHPMRRTGMWPEGPSTADQGLQTIKYFHWHLRLHINYSSCCNQIPSLWEGGLFWFIGLRAYGALWLETMADSWLWKHAASICKTRNQEQGELTLSWISPGLLFILSRIPVQWDGAVPH